MHLNSTCTVLKKHIVLYTESEKRSSQTACKKTSKNSFIFWFPVGASGGLTRPERQSGVSAQVPAQTCNGVAKVSLSFNPSNLAIITLQLRAPACHRKRSALDQPLSTAFFSPRLFLTSSYKCQDFILFFFSYIVSVKYCRGASRSDVGGERKKTLLFPQQCFCRQWCVSFSLLSHLLEMPSPPATLRSLWKKLLRSQTFWQKWTSAGRFALQSFLVSYGN